MKALNKGSTILPHANCHLIGSSEVHDIRPQRSDQDPDNIVKLRNPNLKNVKEDNLYHLALSTATHNLKEMFGDIKFVCMGGTPSRMQRFAQFVKKGPGIHLPTGAELCDISEASHRYCMYKMRSVLSVSFVLGECVRRPCVLDGDLVRELVDVGNRFLPAMNIVRGKTLSTDDFYEGTTVSALQNDLARERFITCHRMNGLNAASTTRIVSLGPHAKKSKATSEHTKIKHCSCRGVICVALLDRLEGDKVDVPDYDMIEWQERPQELALQFIRNRLPPEHLTRRAAQGSTAVPGRQWFSPEHLTRRAAHRATADPGLHFPARAPVSASSPGNTADPGLQCIPPEHLPRRETTGATTVVVLQHRRHR
ncbi:hypothetical protein HPB51_001924 [Rhipicephalus microplus]|uniref:Uncharacterized protein n=1 Tax=Rhipicephalus microplus TaxID=6941 RepID=A0A9J6DKU5_RHIMP|nr:hypothetical protein HPB51_001924 [Rhipicephalus microplus]